VLVWRAGNLLRIVLAVVEGVVRFTFQHRSSSSSSGLARLDSGYGRTWGEVPTVKPLY
jgi:hypothetical protein